MSAELLMLVAVEPGATAGTVANGASGCPKSLNVGRVPRTEAPRELPAVKASQDLPPTVWEPASESEDAPACGALIDFSAADASRRRRPCAARSRRSLQSDQVRLQI